MPWIVIGALAIFCASARASALDDDNQYEMFKDQDGRYRFNNKNGEVEKMIKDGDIIDWQIVPTKKSVRPPTEVKETASKTKPARAPAPAPKENKDSDVASPKPPPPDKIDDPFDPDVHIIGPDNEDITELITDEHRKNAETTITTYINKLSLSHTIQIGERIKGTIMVRNNGDKKLKALELTLSIPVNGKNKPEERRFLFVEKAKGFIAPPQPGKDSLPLLQRVDIPAPPGDIKGSPELRISYLQFAE